MNLDIQGNYKPARQEHGAIPSSKMAREQVGFTDQDAINDTWWAGSGWRGLALRPVTEGGFHFSVPFLDSSRGEIQAVGWGQLERPPQDLGLSGLQRGFRAQATR
jgi:hypothetical protein